MPFAHCLDCGDQALIDPSGRCPEGHEVGSAGVRVSAAIGSATPHPDEPVPWTRTVHLDPERIDAASPRTARPPSVATTEQDAPKLDDASDDLFAELQALGDLGGDTAPAPPPPTPPSPQHHAPAPAPSPRADLPAAAPASPPPPATAASPGAAAPRPAPPSSPEEATDLDDLADVAAVMRSLDERGPQPPVSTPPPAAAATPPPAAAPPPPAARAERAPSPAESAAELDALFASDVRRDALADVAALDRAAARPTPPPPAADPAAATAAPQPDDVAATPPPPARLDDLDFTAKSTRASRRSQPMEAKTTAKRGMFRR